ncbi:hypothetical protein DFH07DRAFT_441426 [Mycena maculata]|uniref:Uncharacterized protein n=1 Tax=Mycena maculata TaxID=230809 RepID=A0AAD7NGK5_9AGAR|nr:hypothetical protein DFH07DRAFT_441426 [Mycena maculata]
MLLVTKGSLSAALVSGVPVTTTPRATHAGTFRHLPEPCGRKIHDPFRMRRYALHRLAGSVGCGITPLFFVETPRYCSQLGNHQLPSARTHTCQGELVLRLRLERDYPNFILAFFPRRVAPTFMCKIWR